MRDDEIINGDELYTISLYNSKSNDKSCLDVVSDKSQVEELKKSGNENSILRIQLELAYGRLHNYRYDTKWWLWGIKCIDKKDNKDKYKYKIENLDIIKREIKKYKTIRIWIDKNDSNSYMFALFFVGMFYKLIINKKIIVAEINDYFKNEISLDDFKEYELEKETIDKYKLEWQRQLEIGSDIRDVRNGVIRNYLDQDLYKTILDVIKPLGRVNRMTAITKLQESNILNNGHPIIYNYLIQSLIQNNTLEEYKIENLGDSADDEYVNNEIEYIPWRYSLVGNIIDRRIYGENHEIKQGTKNFSPGTKVYVDYAHWGDGGEQRVVIGVPKNRKSLIECVIRCEYICNFRLKKIYPSKVLDKMDNSYYSWWGRDEETKKWIMKSAEFLNEHAQEEGTGLANETVSEFLANIDNLNAEENLLCRIDDDFNIKTESDLVYYCKKMITNKECKILRDGKNWCCEINGIRILVNAASYNVVAMHVIS